MYCVIAVLKLNTIFSEKKDTTTRLVAIIEEIQKCIESLICCPEASSLQKKDKNLYYAIIANIVLI
jgi:hypothetical protein